MDRRWVTLGLLLVTLFIFGCTGGLTTQGNVTNPSVSGSNQSPPTVKTYQCPNGINVTDLSNCPKCPVTCDDNNPCTRDYCDSTTQFRCMHENFTGSQINCSGYCSNGTCVSKKKTPEEIANETFTLINEEREKRGIPSLRWADDVAEVAKNHSENVAENGYPLGLTTLLPYAYGYNDSSCAPGFIFRLNEPSLSAFCYPETSVDRLDGAGIFRYASGENVFMIDNYSDNISKDVTYHWMHAIDSNGNPLSTNTTANLLEGIFEESGLGVAVSNNGSYYFTQDFILREGLGVTGMPPYKENGSCAPGFRLDASNSGGTLCYPNEPFFIIEPYLLESSDTNISINASWDRRFSGGISKRGFIMWLNSFSMLDKYWDNFSKAIEGFGEGNVSYYNRSNPDENKLYYLTILSIDWNNERDGEEFLNALPIHAMYNSPHAFYKQFDLGSSRTAIRFGSNIRSYGTWPYHEFYGYIYLYSDYSGKNSFVVETNDLAVMKSVLNQTGRDFSFVDFMQ